MKVAELSGVDLDYWVAKAMDLPLRGDVWHGDGVFVGHGSGDLSPFAPSTDWTAGGPLIESNQVFLSPPHSKHVSGGLAAGWRTENDWTATVSARVRTYREPGDEGWVKDQGRVGRGAGATPLIAAMRAIVTSVYGREVPDA